MDCTVPGFPALHCLPKFAQTHILWVSDAIQPSHSLLPSSPALSLSQHQSLFQWIGSSHQVAKGLKLLFQHQSFQWLFKVDSFRIDCFDLLTVHRILKSFLQHCSLKASSLWCSASFMVQLSHLYVVTGKTIPLTVWTFVSKVLSLVFNMLSRLVIAFLLRSKCPLISWLQSLSAVILKPKRIKSVTVSITHTHTHTHTHLHEI